MLVEGVREGNTTFTNTLKYVFTATSANFENMFSMADASPLLPFLPLGRLLGFTPLPGVLLTLIGLMILLYVLAAEMAKWAFYRTVHL